jgi:hypothetical protein
MEARPRPQGSITYESQLDRGFSYEAASIPGVLSVVMEPRTDVDGCT